MSRGNRILSTRMPVELLTEMEITVARRNIHTREEPWNITRFLQIAIREKLDKMERSRKQGGKPKRQRNEGGDA